MAARSDTVGATPTGINTTTHLLGFLGATSPTDVRGRAYGAGMVGGGEQIMGWRHLSEELRSEDQPIRVWLEERLPDYESVRVPFWLEVKPLPGLAPPQDVPRGTTSAACKFMTMIRLAGAAFEPTGPLIGATCMGAEIRPWTAAVRDLYDIAVRAGTEDRDSSMVVLARACWTLVLFSELAKNVPVHKTLLAPYAGSAPPDTDDLLAVLPDQFEEDLVALGQRTATQLEPFVRKRCGTDQLVLTPQLEAPINGRPDMVAGSAMIHMDIVSPRKFRDGRPRYGLDRRALYELVAYSLLTIEKYPIDTIVRFNPRFRHLYTWNTQVLMNQLACNSVDVRALGAEFRDFLRTEGRVARPAPPRRPSRAGHPTTLLSPEENRDHNIAFARRMVAGSEQSGRQIPDRLRALAKELTQDEKGT